MIVPSRFTKFPSKCVNLLGMVIEQLFPEYRFSAVLHFDVSHLHFVLSLIHVLLSLLQFGQSLLHFVLSLLHFCLSLLHLSILSEVGTDQPYITPHFVDHLHPRCRSSVAYMENTLCLLWLKDLNFRKALPTI